LGGGWLSSEGKNRRASWLKAGNKKGGKNLVLRKVKEKVSSGVPPKNGCFYSRREVYGKSFLKTFMEKC